MLCVTLINLCVICNAVFYQTCSHPFLVDHSLSSSLLKDVKEMEYLDVGIKASGKLQLLDSMLLEMRKRGLRVLILYEVCFIAL